jgi:NHLM bacteriocin system ABC transporter peptidase/ATP-binding protein
VLARSRAARPARVKTPTVIQMEALECGAAALGIVLAYFGRVVPLEELRLACGVSRDGSKASNIVRAARAYGLQPRAYRMEPEALLNLTLPMIVFWEFNHFLVVEGFGRNCVYLNDPADGPRTVTAEEFDGSFTGVVLTFEPGPGFTRGGASPSLVSALRGRLAGSTRALVQSVLAGLGLALLDLTVPAFTRAFVDHYLIAGLSNWVPGILGGLALVCVLLVGLTGLQQHFLYQLGQRLTLTAASKFFWHVLNLPVEFFTVRYAGDLAARVQLNQRVGHFLSTQLATNAVDLLMIALYAVVMLQYDLELTVIGVGITLLNVLALRYVSRKRTDLSRRLARDRGLLLSTSFSGLQMIEELKASGAESDFFARWAGYQARLLNGEQELGVLTQCLSGAPALLAALSTALVLASGGERVIAGGLSIGALVAFQYLLSGFSAPVSKLVTLGGYAQELESDLQRLDDVMRYRTDPNLDGQAAAAAYPGRLTGQLELRNVTFGYDRLAPPLIDGLSLVLRPGARVALIGASGSGKSTVAKLVCGLYQPWSGEILFDGRPRTEHDRSVMTNSLALVDQDSCLFEDTVRNNLTLWDATTSEQSFVRAARDARIHDDVAVRPAGYTSGVQEAGANFSGGQRQRLEIARALSGDPAILVLDEATSALDPATEELIDDGLRRRGCTCLIIAHRLSTIRDCDEIIVLEAGRIVQRGRHAEMRDVDGPYAQLISAE